MRKATESPLRFASVCFPPASPAVVPEAGKQKTTPKDPSQPLICLKKIGAGEGIRTLDPDLGKVGNVTLATMPSRRLGDDIVSFAVGAGGRNRTDTSVRKPDFASHYGFRHDAFALQHRRFDGLDFIFTMGFRR